MLSILIELQRLKNLDRTGWSLRGLAPRTESVAAHSFGVAVTAMMLADQLSARGIDVDVSRVLRIALLHDWAEARIGDMPRTATQYFGSEARKKAELAAFEDIIEESGSVKESYRGLYEEYEQRSSLEARLVKAADVIDLLIQVLALERAGTKGLDEFWDIAHYGDFQLTGPAHDIVTEMLEQLLRSRAQANTAV
jgi:putative hydrolase of HD superfamily